MKIHTPLEEGLGDWIDGAQKSSFEDADIVLLPGGTDVNPALYGHTKLPTTFVYQDSDDEEVSLMDHAVQNGKFLVGICKGAQMLTAKAGGWLIQHVDGHHNHHDIQTHDGLNIKVNSCHHQMCYPYDLPDDNYELLAWAKGISQKYEFSGVPFNSSWYNIQPSALDEGKFKEPEVIWYPKIRGLAVQGHPEWNSCPAEFNEWLNKLILEKL